jgi:hypothetical protein
VFIEQFSTVLLPINRLDHFKNNITTFISCWPIILGEFHKEGAISRLRALTEG